MVDSALIHMPDQPDLEMIKRNVQLQEVSAISSTYHVSASAIPIP